MLSLCRFSLVVALRDYSLAEVHGLPTVVASLIGDHRPWGMKASGAAAPGLLVLLPGL